MPWKDGEVSSDSTMRDDCPNIFWKPVECSGITVVHDKEPTVPGTDIERSRGP